MPSLSKTYEGGTVGQSRSDFDEVRPDALLGTYKHLVLKWNDYNTIIRFVVSTAESQASVNLNLL